MKFTAWLGGVVVLYLGLMAILGGIVYAFTMGPEFAIGFAIASVFAMTHLAFTERRAARETEQQGES